MRKTLLQLVTLLIDEANNHQQVNAVYYGTEDILNRDAELKPFTVRYALDSVNYESNQVTFTMIFEVWGETAPDDSDRIFQESECESILNDLVSSVHNGTIRDEGFQLNLNTDGTIAGVFVANSVVHEKEGRLTGLQMSVDIVGINDYNFCEFPNNTTT